MAVSVPFKVISCSSSDDVYPASNLMLPEHYRFWSTAAPEKKATVELQLAEPTKISSLTIINQGSAFVEVLVSSSTNPGTEQVLLPVTGFMQFADVVSGTNKSRSMTFTDDKLQKAVMAQKWDRMKLVCTQPFREPTRIGLALVQVFADRPYAQPGPGKGAAAFVIPSLDDDETPKAATNLFSVRHTLSATAIAPKQQSTLSFTTKPSPAASVSPVKPSPPKPTQSPSQPSYHTTPPQPQQPKPQQPKQTLAVTAKPQPTSMAPPPTAAPQPSFVQKKRPVEDRSHALDGVVIVISGIANPERGKLREIVLAMGGGYRPDWTPGESTHLIATQAGTQKHIEALSSGGVVVTKDWVYACDKQASLVPTQQFEFQTSGPPPLKPVASIFSSQQSSPQQKLAPPGFTQPPAKKPKVASDEDIDSGDETEDMDDTGAATTTASTTTTKPNKAVAASTASANYVSLLDDGSDTEDMQWNTTATPALTSAPVPAASHQYNHQQHQQHQQPKPAKRKTSTTQDLQITVDAPPALPCFFDGLTFAILGELSKDERRMVYRYITAYNGVLEDDVSSATTHAIASDSMPMKDAQAQVSPSTKVVRPSWVQSCHAKQRLVPVPHQ